MPVRRWRMVGLTVAVLLAGCASGSSPAATPSSAAPSDPPNPAVSGLPTGSPGAAQPSGDGVYLALGDSITSGIGVIRPSEDGFPALVAAALADADPPIAETEIIAVPGETAANFRDTRLDIVRSEIESFGPRVQLVTVGLGVNDVMAAIGEPACTNAPDTDACRALVDAAITQAAEALDTIVVEVGNALDANGSSASILLFAHFDLDVVGMPPGTVVGSDGEVACDPADPHPGLNDRIACVAEERGVTLVDLHAAFEGQDLEEISLGEGDTHPNEAGHELIAQAILQAIERGG